MRIALLTHQWPGARMGGIGSAVRQIAASLAVAGHEAHVFTLTLPADVRDVLRELPAGVTVHEVPGLAERGQINPAISAAGEGAYRLALGWLLCDAMVAMHRDQPFDIVEAPEVEGLALPLLLNASHAPGLPIVTHLHLCTAISDQTNGYLPCDTSEQLVRDLEFAAIAAADGVCGPSQNVIDLTRQLVNVRDDVQVIPYAFDAGNDGFSLPPKDGELLFIGRIERRKGVMPLADALNRFLARNPTARFCFAGPDTSTAPNGGSMRNWIRERLHPAIRDRVRFTGELPPGQVREALRNCRFCVLPSVSENFSVALCETMAAGRTAIVFDGTGSPEVIGNAGIVVPQGSVDGLDDAIQRLWNDSSLLNSLSERAHSRIRTLCDPMRVGICRGEFYHRVIERTKHNRAVNRVANAAVLSGFSAMIGALTGTSLATQQASPGSRLLKIMEDYGANEPIWLYGAGKHTERLLAERGLWEKHGFGIGGLIDDHPRFENVSAHLGLRVMSLSRFVSRKLKSPVVLSTDTYQDQFWDRTAPLRAAGVKVFRLYERSQAKSAA